MAIELVRKIWCDGHLQATGNQVEGFTIPPVTLPSGKQKVVDLCESCQKEISYMLLIELADNFGRDAEVIKARGKRYTEPLHTEEERQCRFCNRAPFETRRGRIRHEQQSHEEQYNRAETQDSPVSVEPGDIEVEVKTTKRTAKKAVPATN